MKKKLQDNEVMVFYLVKDSKGFTIKNTTVSSQDEIEELRKTDNYSHLLTNGWYIDDGGKKDYTKGGTKLYGKEYDFILKDVQKDYKKEKK